MANYEEECAVARQIAEDASTHAGSASGFSRWLSEFVQSPSLLNDDPPAEMGRGSGIPTGDAGLTRGGAFPLHCRFPSLPSQSGAAG